MENHKRNKELDLALFHLNTEIHEKIGEDYANLCHTFDRLDTEEVIKTMTDSLHRAYPGSVMGKLIEENFNLDRNYSNVKKVICGLEKERDTYKEKAEILEKENKDLLRMVEVLQKRLDKRVKNSRDDIDAEEVKYLHENGMSVIELAEKFQTNRQTIYNKLHKPTSSNGLYG